MTTHASYTDNDKTPRWYVRQCGSDESADEQAAVPITVQRDPAMKCAVCGHSEQEFLNLTEKLAALETLLLGETFNRVRKGQKITVKRENRRKG
jgi:hypothetical protein